MRFLRGTNVNVQHGKELKMYLVYRQATVFLVGVSDQLVVVLGEYIHFIQYSFSEMFKQM